jgi:hypothetical protein
MTGSDKAAAPTAWMRSKISWMARGMTPGSSSVPIYDNSQHAKQCGQGERMTIV